MIDLLEKARVDLIQMRNFSIDPVLYMRSVPRPAGKAIGIRALIRRLKKGFPALKIGYFNLPKAEW
jgi:hypothetical protein